MPMQICCMKDCMIFLHRCPDASIGTLKGNVLMNAWVKAGDHMVSHNGDMELETV